jgi:hypothetical protein
LEVSEVTVPKDPEDELSIGEVVRRTGVAASALHYYEKLGLIASRRTAGFQRRYARHMLRRISLQSLTPGVSFVRSVDRPGRGTTDAPARRDVT